MKAVDAFLEQLTEDYAALQKENAALKSKMKVLVDKIEEYKSIEGGIRQALVSAQNIADDMVKKAKEESSKYLTEASNAAQSQIAQLQEQTRQEEGRLQAAQNRIQDFVQKMTEFYQGEIRALDQLANHVEIKPAVLPEMPAPAENTVRQPEPPAKTEEMEKTKDMEHLMRRLANPQPEPAAQAGPEEQSAPSAGGTVSSRVIEVTLGEKGKAQKPLPTFTFDDLKFGKDYSPEDDQ